MASPAMAETERQHRLRLAIRSTKPTNLCKAIVCSNEQRIPIDSLEKKMRVKIALVFTLLASLAVLSFTAPVVLLPEDNNDADTQANFDGAEDVELQNSQAILANSDPAQYSFSDVHSSCTNIATIDSPGGWCTAGGSSGFMIIDLKRVMNVEGIQTQGRGDCHQQWVSVGDMSFSDDGQRWEVKVMILPYHRCSQYNHT